MEKNRNELANQAAERDKVATTKNADPDENQRAKVPPQWSDLRKIHPTSGKYQDAASPSDDFGADSSDLSSVRMTMYRNMKLVIIFSL